MLALEAEETFCKTNYTERDERQAEIETGKEKALNKVIAARNKLKLTKLNLQLEES